MITKFEAEVLLHTSSNGRYVTDEADVIGMAKAGLLFDYGPQALASGAHYLVTTPAGRAALGEWKVAQPKPPKLKRSPRSAAFQAWRDYLEAYRDRMPFPQFLKEVLPYRSHWP